MPITPLPAPPLRSDGPATFADKGDAFMVALPVFAVEANALEVNVNAQAATVESNTATAVAAASAALANTNASKWISGTFAVGDVRWSPIDSLSYRCKTAGVRATDPSLDPTNWALLGASADFLTSSITAERTAIVALTNKTIAGTTNNVEARSLKSATTTVSVSASAAPISGQVLTATSGTAATWQTPSGTGTGAMSSVIGSRALGVTYTNSGTTTRFVMVSARATSSNVYSITGLVNGANVISSGFAESAVDTVTPVCISFPVPPGGTFRVNGVNATLTLWSEYQ